MTRLFSLALLFFSTLLLTSCGTSLRSESEIPDFNRYYADILATGSMKKPVDYHKEVKPLLEKRCVVCHGCYDAPCQLKLSSYEGLTRGGSKHEVYDSTRLVTAHVTRLFIDAHTTAEWRKKEFHSVLNEAEASPEANLEESLVASMLALKQANPLPQGERLLKGFDLALDRKQQCSTIDEFSSFASKKPLWGMPYGLPGLRQEEYDTLMRWLAQGAQGDDRIVLSPGQRAQVAQWEAFFNGSSNKEKLVTRYLYEHLFLADLYLEDDESRRWFNLVRSHTAPGEPIDIIDARRPFSNPGTAPFYYRLQPVRSATSLKNHLPYALGRERMARWRELFIDRDFHVDSLPSYKPKVAANPFKVFQAVPVQSRYRFLLDDARFFIGSFIKGPVCRGQAALNVIQDHFWVFFLDPDSPIIREDGDRVLARMGDKLRLPAAESESHLTLYNWLKYRAQRKEFLNQKREYLRQRFATPEDINLNLVWDGGDNNNSGAALTVFRHFDSAVVSEGLLGDSPQGAWLISYNLLERIHYLLVAGFDVYGNLNHQLNSRLYMDFLRMDGEYNFLMLLPKAERKRMWHHWYRNAHKAVRTFVDDQEMELDQESGIPFVTDDPMSELLEMLHGHIGDSLSRQHQLVSGEDEWVEGQLSRLGRLKGTPVVLLPQFTLITLLDADGQQQLYSLIHNNAHSNIAHLSREMRRRLPEEDSLTVTSGVQGSYPNLLLRMQRSQVADFVAELSSMTGQSDYRRLLDRYAVRRTSDDFWSHSDSLHAKFRQLDPIESGLFDYN
ncbi:MAG: fatty acid cis/trans isomerase, partial [Sedimenticola sp.]